MFPWKVKYLGPVIIGLPTVLVSTLIVTKDDKVGVSYHQYTFNPLTTENARGWYQVMVNMVMLIAKAPFI